MSQNIGLSNSIQLLLPQTALKHCYIK